MEKEPWKRGFVLGRQPGNELVGKKSKRNEGRDCCKCYIFSVLSGVKLTNRTENEMSILLFRENNEAIKVDIGRRENFGLCRGIRCEQMSIKDYITTQLMISRKTTVVEKDYRSTGTFQTFGFGIDIPNGQNLIGTRIGKWKVAIETRTKNYVREKAFPKNVLERTCLTFDEQRHERYHRWRQLAHRDPVRPVIAARVDEGLILGELFPGLGRQLVPGGRQPAYGHVAQSHEDGEERVEVVVLFAAENGRRFSVDGNEKKTRWRMISAYKYTGLYILYFLLYFYYFI